jgi:putative FmdB family regulatory protein
MPIYEYRCEKCGDFEEMQRITDPPLAKCPRCKGKVRRLISNTSFQLKGSGWYVTDYGRSGAGNGGKKSGTGESSGGEASGGETKPAASETTTSKPATTGGGEKSSS